MSAGENIARAAESQVGNTNGFKYLGGNGSQAWCDDFASWCLQQAGYQGYGQQASVPQSVQWAKNNNLWHQQGSGYQPQVGDLVTFDWNGDGTADHVGVVTGRNSNGTLQVTAGNSNGYGKTGGESASAGAVTEKTFNMGSSEILGYISTSGGQAGQNVAGTGNAGNAGNAGGAGPTESFSGNAGNIQLQNAMMGLLASALGGNMSQSQLLALESALQRGALAPNSANNLSGFTGFPSSGVSPNSGTNYGGVSSAQSQGIQEIARKVADQNGIPENVFLAIIDHESGFNANALGDPGIGGTVNGNYASVGLGQVNTTAHPDFNVQQALHGNNGQPDVMYQLQYSANMLKQLYNKYGSWQLAVEHYNGSGPQAQQYANNVMNLAQKFGGSGNGGAEV